MDIGFCSPSCLSHSFSGTFADSVHFFSHSHNQTTPSRQRPTKRSRSNCSPSKPELHVRQQTSPVQMGLGPFDWIRKRFEPRVYDLSKLPPSVPAIEVTNLVKRYERQEKRRRKGEKKKRSEILTAVDGLSFNAHRGEIVGLLGPNSSGKSTTLRMVVTLDKPDEGDVYVNGINVRENPRLVRYMLGYVAQDAGVDKVLTGREHLEVFGQLAHLGWRKRKQQIEGLIEVFGLEDFIDRQSGTYSGGIKRRLDLAIALLHQPSVLVLDEPTVGLDMESRKVIWQVLQDLKEFGACVLLTSHYLEEVDVLADKVAILNQGKCISEGSPSELKKQLGGDRISIRLKEFTTSTDAERVGEMLVAKGLALQSFVNRVKNNTIELVVAPDDSRIGDDIMSVLRGAGYSNLFSYSKSKPSLGDVYLKATGKDFQAADMLARQQRDRKTVKKETMI